MRTIERSNPNKRQFKRIRAGSSRRWSKTRVALHEEKSRLRSILAAANRSILSEEMEYYWNRNGLRAEDRIVNLSYLHRGALLRRLRQINEALDRLKAGAYGLCLECRRKIEKRRLEEDPAAPFCSECGPMNGKDDIPLKLWRYLQAS
jgi:RNA polymerase-binding transcription factor DksA